MVEADKLTPRLQSEESKIKINILLSVLSLMKNMLKLFIYTNDNSLENT
jgi:hypothetical protein